MRTAIALLMLTVFGGGYLLRGASPRYEVATVKPNRDNDSRFSFRIEPDGALSATGITLRRLMMTAYNVQGFRIVGGPDWLNSMRWDVQAKREGAVPPNQVKDMIRSLLEERFRLRSHSEVRKVPIYEVVADTRSSRVPRPKDTEDRPTVRVSAGSIELTNATPATFASQLSYALARPVIDKTRLSGNFDFVLEWTPQPNEDNGPTTAGLPPGISDKANSVVDGPSIFTAIREQLGLRLKSSRGPVYVVVIDDVQMPGPN